MLKFQLQGPFGLIDENGVDRRPSLMKARAILAVLAATPGHRHSRSWFLALLWEDRQREQGLTSLRSALTNIRRHLGPFADVLISDHSEIALDPSAVSTDLNAGAPAGEFLEGFDIAHAPEFEDWLRQMRMTRSERCNTIIPAKVTRISTDSPQDRPTRLYLAARGSTAASVTQVQCETLVDCLAKSCEDLSLAEAIDGRGQGETLQDFQDAAARADADLILISEAAESSGGSIARTRVIEVASQSIVWSKSITGTNALDLENPSTIGAVAEFIDVMTGRLLREFHWHNDALPPNILATAGVNQIFKLGMQNYETAEAMLKQAHALDPRGRHLAWRAYLRTFLLGELEFGDRKTVIEEGTALARRAMESEPNNSMVLALCAHVENMLHNSYQNAVDLATRSLEINRCNPLAWASLGLAAAFLGESDEGSRIASVGAKLAAGARYSFQTESWASAAALLAGDLATARAHAERSHSKAPTFAPPLRYLSALYCSDGQFERARTVAQKLRVREPDFSFDSLRDEGYPADSVRQARLLDALPAREF